MSTEFGEGGPSGATLVVCLPRVEAEDAAHLGKLNRVNYPVIDGHNDLLWELRSVDYDFTQIDIATEQSRVQTDLPRARRGGLAAQFWSVYVPSTLSEPEAVVATLQQIDAFEAMVSRYGQDLRQVRTPDELDDILDGWVPGRPIASLMGAEGGHCLANSPAVLRTYYRLGVRYLTLTHNDNTDWADSATDEPRHGGLTRLGRDIVAEMNRIGMMVDLSHVAASTMADALDTSTAPVIFSHSSARAICDHPRNVPDEILARLPDNGGLCMTTFVGYFLSEEVREWHRRRKEAAERAGIDPDDHDSWNTFFSDWPDPRPAVAVSSLADHVDHIREVAGIDHVGLGGDYDGTDFFPVGMEDVTGYPVLLAELAERGWSADDLHRLTHRNLQRVFRDVSEAAQPETVTSVV